MEKEPLVSDDKYWISNCGTIIFDQVEWNGDLKKYVSDIEKKIKPRVRANNNTLELKKVECNSDDIYRCGNTTYKLTECVDVKEWENNYFQNKKYIAGIDPVSENSQAKIFEQQGGKYKPYKPTGTDYSSNGPVFKDETTKDLLAQLKDAKSAFYLLVGMFILSFMLNIAFTWCIWNSSSDTVYPLSPKEIQKRIKAHRFVGASDTLYINSKK